MEKTMSSKIYDKAFLTGCDSNTEWMLPWFLDNYHKHNNLPLILADFGMTKFTLEALKEQKRISAVIDLTKTKEEGWFKKPLSMRNCPSKFTCWIDTDCQVLGDISSVFDHVEDQKIAMVCDRPWTNRSGEIWFNSGIVAFKDKPRILDKWVQGVKDNPLRGDQETLHYEVLKTPLDSRIYITELPNKYNWLRVQIENDNHDSKDKLVMHWTGKKGKDRIKGMMNG